MRTSADFSRSSNIATASGCFRSSATEGRPRFEMSFAKSMPIARAMAAPSLRSTRNTSAPRSASSIAANGPGPMPAISMTLTPASGPARITRTSWKSLQFARRSRRRGGSAPDRKPVDCILPSGVAPAIGPARPAGRTAAFGVSVGIAARIRVMCNPHRPAKWRPSNKTPPARQPKRSPPRSLRDGRCVASASMR